MVSSLLLIVSALILAYGFSRIAKKVGLPRTVGEITAGLVLSIVLIKTIITTPESLANLEFLANLGIILLFYYVGLETNFKAFTKNIKTSALVSLFNTSVPLIIGFIFMKFIFHFDTLVSLIIGICLSVSAQAVSVDILEELNLLKSKIGARIIGTGAIDDTIELIIVSIILSLVHFSISNITPSQLLLNFLLFLIIIILLRLLIIPRILLLFEKEKETLKLMGALILVLMIVVISESLGLGALIGALIAGAVVRQTIFKEKKIPFWEEHQLSKSIHIIAFGFLIPLFFVWVGMNTDFSLLLSFKDLLFVLLLTAIAVIGTVGGTALAVRMSNGTWKEGFILGWGLNPKGDTELVIATIALQASIINKELFSAIVLMSFITTIISPIVFRRLLKKAPRKLKQKF
ncbi:cation:proton antiporter [Candidatus Woesearchaeota archaeon]|nr:cation:proton antiporter [Candidatus Woesearchaeota archaeon]